MSMLNLLLQCRGSGEDDDTGDGRTLQKDPGLATRICLYNLLGYPPDHIRLPFSSTLYREWLESVPY